MTDRGVSKEAGQGAPGLAMAKPWTFDGTIRDLGATQTFIRAGRPATNGAVQRVQRTILQA